MNRLRFLIILALVPLGACGLFNLDPMLKSNLRESEAALIAPAIECYKQHGTMPNPADPTKRIPFDDDKRAAIDFEHDGLRRAIDADEVKP